MPKISVIIPVYNMEKYVGACLDVHDYSRDRSVISHVNSACSVT